MHVRVLSLTGPALLAACGCGAQDDPGLAAHGTPPPGLEEALAQVRSVAEDAAHPPAPLPGFKVSARTTQGLTGLDLWNAVVDPMIAPLTPLDGSAELHRVLNPAQYAVYALFAVSVDIDDGGISEVYFNHSGVFAEEAIGLLRTVGAPRHADVLTQANRIIAPSGDVPRARGERQRRLDATDLGRFAALDAAYGALEPLEDVVARFIRAHPRDFFV